MTVYSLAQAPSSSTPPLVAQTAGAKALIRVFLAKVKDLCSVDDAFQGVSPRDEIVLMRAAAKYEDVIAFFKNHSAILGTNAVCVQDYLVVLFNLAFLHYRYAAWILDNIPPNEAGNTNKYNPQRLEQLLNLNRRATEQFRLSARAARSCREAILKLGEREHNETSPALMETTCTLEGQSHEYSGKLLMMRDIKHAFDSEAMKEFREAVAVLEMVKPRKGGAVLWEAGECRTTSLYCIFQINRTHGTVEDAQRSFRDANRAGMEHAKSLLFYKDYLPVAGYMTPLEAVRLLGSIIDSRSHFVPGMSAKPGNQWCIQEAKGAVLVARILIEGNWEALKAPGGETPNIPVGTIDPILKEAFLVVLDKWEREERGRLASLIDSYGAFGKEIRRELEAFRAKGSK